MPQHAQQRKTKPTKILEHSQFVNPNTPSTTGNPSHTKHARDIPSGEPHPDFLQNLFTIKRANHAQQTMPGNQSHHLL
jgi:hypothetical protein